MQTMYCFIFVKFFQNLSDCIVDKYENKEKLIHDTFKIRIFYLEIIQKDFYSTQNHKAFI